MKFILNLFVESAKHQVP